jgi:malate dehydrogenase (oxaloacetate-decarboxylating)
MPLDCTYHLQNPHRSGELARIATTIARERGVIGDVVTVALGRTRSVREITVEVRDSGQADRIAAALDELDEVKVLWHEDRALLKHVGGKLEIDSVRPVRNVQDMRDVYTPGVARVCTAIAEDPALARRYTMIGRTVAVCTNGTRVLGLGDIGPVASMPVMEGKAVFYRQCVGLSAMPILIDAKDPDTFVETVKRIASGFGGIHLEDISAPECFEIEARLKAELEQPVMHDDVHGTAVVTLAAALVACRTAGLMLPDATVGQIGLGAAGYGIASLFKDAGVHRVVASDPSPASHVQAEAHGIEVLGSLAEVMAEADVVVATSGHPGLITPELVREGQVILALTNPDPEIRPEEALAAGAAYAADGSVVNNVLGYPGIFKGALDAGAREISVVMKQAAAWAIAGLTVESELVPDALDPTVHEHVAEAVAAAARTAARGGRGPDSGTVG